LIMQLRSRVKRNIQSGNANFITRSRMVPNGMESRIRSHRAKRIALRF
jgi:hypothetical protein